MSQVELPYEEMEKEFIDALVDLGREDLHSERGVLATSYARAQGNSGSHETWEFDSKKYQRYQDPNARVLNT